MPVGRRDQREPAHARAPARVLRQERRLRLRLVQVLDDGERLEERRAALVDDERGHDALRIDREVVLAHLLALEEVDGDLLGLEAF